MTLKSQLVLLGGPSDLEYGYMERFGIRWAHLNRAISPRF